MTTSGNSEHNEPIEKEEIKSEVQSSEESENESVDDVFIPNEDCKAEMVFLNPHSDLQRMNSMQIFSSDKKELIILSGEDESSSIQK